MWSSLGIEQGLVSRWEAFIEGRPGHSEEGCSSCVLPSGLGWAVEVLVLWVSLVAG